MRSKWCGGTVDNVREGALELQIVMKCVHAGLIIFNCRDVAGHERFAHLSRVYYKSAYVFCSIHLVMATEPESYCMLLCFFVYRIAAIIVFDMTR